MKITNSCYADAKYIHFIMNLLWRLFYAFCIFSIDMNALKGKEYALYVSIIPQCFSRREFISIENVSPSNQNLVEVSHGVCIKPIHFLYVENVVRNMRYQIKP
jgi:hypothetical protein